MSLLSGAPTWFRCITAAMGACTPGGFLFLLALVTDGNVNMPHAAWFAMAAVGGVAGFFLPNLLKRF